MLILRHGRPEIALRKYTSCYSRRRSQSSTVQSRPVMIARRGSRSIPNTQWYYRPQRMSIKSRGLGVRNAAETGKIEGWWALFRAVFPIWLLVKGMIPDAISLPRGAGLACWWERRSRDRKVASSNPGRSGGRIFFPRVNFERWLLSDVRSTPVLPQWHVKDPGHSPKSADGGLHLNTHTPLSQWSRSGLTMPLCRHSVETY